MTKAVQRRRGTAAEHNSFTGLEGEFSYNSTNKSAHVHDGSTPGGFQLARADLDNVTIGFSDLSAAVIDEDNMASNSAVKVPTQQSVKAYVDNTRNTFNPASPGNLGATTPIPNLHVDTIHYNGVEITATPAQINFLTGVTSNIQTQLNARYKEGDSPTFTAVTTDDGEVYAPGNILDPVSESSGVPTGGIIEEGANTNGKYVKYASGAMICWHQLSGSFSSASATTSGDQVWTFPAEFVGQDPRLQRTCNNSVNGSGDQDNNRGYARGMGLTQAGFRYTWGTNYGSSGTWRIDVLAIGRWF